MSIFKRIFGTSNIEHPTTNIQCWGERKEKLRKMRERVGQLPADDPVMLGLLAWQEERVATMLRECDDRNLTGEQALSLVHRLAETAAFRADLERVWKEERGKVENIQQPTSNNQHPMG